MIIQSNFKDYYDRVLAHGQRDPKILYHRATKEIPRSALKGSKLGEFLRGFETVWGQDENIHVGIFLIAGKLYPIEIRHNIGEDPQFHYKDPYRAFQPSKKDAKWAATMAKKYPKREAIWGQSDPDAAELNLKHGPVLLLIECGVHIFGKIDTTRGLTANPPLGVLKFPMNSHELIQSIMAFLGTEKPITVTSNDAIRAQAHGLDKTSFRRDPGGPTRKRKKHKAN